MDDSRTLCDAVDGAGMMRQHGTLAEWMKLSGTADEAVSLHHIQTQLDALGFSTRLLEHDAYISLPGASVVTVSNAMVPSIMHSFSRASAKDGLAARLVRSDRRAIRPNAAWQTQEPRCRSVVRRSRDSGAVQRHQ